MEFREVVNVRRSVRSFTDQEVEAETFTRIFEAARMAPSWANRQCWSYILVEDQEKIKELAGGFVNPWMKQTKAIIVACGDPTKSGS
jgi:nitroreductase